MLPLCRGAIVLSVHILAFVPLICTPSRCRSLVLLIRTLSRYRYDAEPSFSPSILLHSKTCSLRSFHFLHDFFAPHILLETRGCFISFRPAKLFVRLISCCRGLIVHQGSVLLVHVPPFAIGSSEIFPILPQFFAPHDLLLQCGDISLFILPSPGIVLERAMIAVCCMPC